MMKRASIRIRGDVQMAGFRTFINNVADSLHVTGFAENEMVALMRSFDKKGEVIIGFLGSMNDTLNGVKADTSKMLDKQDETIDVIGEVSERIDRSKGDIVTEISSLRGDLRSYSGLLRLLLFG
jgi:hydrogenase maturation factor HypF (carbamoyltransferase family)